MESRFVSGIGEAFLSFVAHCGTAAIQVAPATLILSAAQTMRANEGSKPQPSTSPKQLSRFRTEDDAAIALEAALENPRTLNQVRASQLPLEKRYVAESGGRPSGAAS